MMVMSPESTSLTHVFKTFIKIAKEMENSLMFPSMLRDMPVINMKGVDIFKDNVEDFKDLYFALMSVKDELLFGLKKNWFSGIEQCLQNSKNHQLTPKFLAVVTSLQEATQAARLLCFKYSSTVENNEKSLYKQDSYSDDETIDRIERVVKNVDVMVVMDEYNSQIQELESIILVPSLLQYETDEKLNSFLKSSTLKVAEGPLY